VFDLSFEFFVEEGCWDNVWGCIRCHVSSDFGTRGGFILLGSWEGGAGVPRIVLP